MSRAASVSHKNKHGTAGPRHLTPAEGPEVSTTFRKQRVLWGWGGASYVPRAGFQDISMSKRRTDALRSSRLPAVTRVRIVLNRWVQARSRCRWRSHLGALAG